MASITQTLTVNAAFLQEIKADNRELWRLMDACRNLVARHEAHLTQAAELSAQLRDQLAFHFALEEAYGYFSDPIDAAPWLCQRAERLRSEHADLYAAASQLADWADDNRHQARDYIDWEWFQTTFRAFDEALGTHERAEEELILDSLTDDVGCGD